MTPLPQIGPLDPFWRHAIDILVSVLVLRVTLGWLVTYRRLVQFLLLFVALVGAGWTVSQLNLPMAQVLGFILIIPLLVLLTLSIVPEFRRIYESASVGRLFAVRQSRQEEMIATILDTVRHLSENRCGAILVFPKRDNIAQFCQGGEEVDARVNKSLLLSILNTRSPRHDGAIVIEGDRITRIGAVLPLAPAEDIDPSWGTRHLAALGLCQASDAELLVVSEERGTVSLGKNGELKRVDFSNDATARSTVADALDIDVDRTRGKKSLGSSLLLWGLAVIIGVSGSLGVEGLRSRLLRRGVFVHNLVLGPVDTPMTRDHEKNRLFAQPRPVAAAIVRALGRRRHRVYVPGIWRWIMLVVRNLPEPIFQRLSFLSGRP